MSENKSYEKKAKSDAVTLVVILCIFIGCIVGAVWTISELFEQKQEAVAIKKIEEKKAQEKQHTVRLKPTVQADYVKANFSVAGRTKDAIAFEVDAMGVPTNTHTAIRSAIKNVGQQYTFEEFMRQGHRATRQITVEVDSILKVGGVGTNWVINKITWSPTAVKVWEDKRKAELEVEKQHLLKEKREKALKLQEELEAEAKRVKMEYAR